MLSWSDKPGCFERHLQRKYLYPFLFTLDSKIITQSLVDEARLQDSEDLAHLEADTTEFLHYLEHNFTLDEVRGLIKRFIALEQRAAEIGGNAVTMGNALRIGKLQLLSKIENILTEEGKQVKDDTFKDYAAVSDIYVHPFFAQCNRTETPIKESEHVASLLTEDVETIRFILSLFDLINKEWVTKYQEEAIILAKSAVKSRNIIPNITTRLRAFDISRNRIFFNVTLYRILQFIRFRTRS
jgi:hypothetical protein